MISLYNLLRIILVLYLGVFSYILYQFLFFHQKRFLFTKTILYFFVLAALIIKASNKYDISIFHIYILFYFLGLYLAKKGLSKYIKKHNTEFNSLLKPIKKYGYILLKIITIPPFI